MAVFLEGGQYCFFQQFYTTVQSMEPDRLSRVRGKNFPILQQPVAVAN